MKPFRSSNILLCLDLPFEPDEIINYKNCFECCLICSQSGTTPEFNTKVDLEVFNVC